MCGIAGILSVRGQDREAFKASLRNMMHALRHRGPDDSDFTAEELPDGAVVGLANTRLAILDLSSAGHQPMTDPDTGCRIVLNGEIYNHLELRKEIGDSAGPWRSGSDTETFLKAYVRFGPECLDRIRGMFSAAIWNPGRRVLWCARDRLGIKPFYFHASPTQFAFASETRALLASGHIPKRLDETGLSGFVRYGSVPEPFTLVEGVRSLPAGHWADVKPGGEAEFHAYWMPKTGPAAPESGKPAERIREELRRAVREHLISDVPVSVFLSGGIDSSAIAALASEASGEPLHTFTVGMEEEAYDEAAFAGEAARRYRTQHHLIRLRRGEVVSAVERAVRTMDQPSIDGVNTFIVSRAVAEAGFKVVLSGLGGDELFGGYRSFQWLSRFERWSGALNWIPGGARTLAGRGWRGMRIAEMAARGVSLSQRYAALRSLWPRTLLDSAGLQSGLLFGTDPEDCPVLATRISVLELTGYMRSVLLRDADAMSMAHGLELRVPFLDHRLVETCLELHAARLGAFDRPKQMLIDALGDLLPREAVKRRKQGFVLPMSEWMMGPLRDFCMEGVRNLEILDVRKRLYGMDVDWRTREFFEGKLPWARFWQFAVLGHWLGANLS